MLSDRERHVLNEVERRLASDDPAFARRFAATVQRLGHGPHRRVARIAIATAVLLGGLLLLAGSAVGALAAVAATGLVWLAWRTCPDTGQWEQR